MAKLVLIVVASALLALVESEPGAAGREAPVHVVRGDQPAAPQVGTLPLPASPPVDYARTLAAIRGPGVHPAGGRSVLSLDDLSAVVARNCVQCHNDRMSTGNLSLQGYDVASAYESWETTEKIIKKLRAGQMPPAGTRRPGGDTLLVLASTLETLVDGAGPSTLRPGTRGFQRLNLAEYRTAVGELLKVDVDPGAWLPPDVQADGFDNVADAQPLSTTLLDGYLRAAGEVSRLAVGEPAATSRQVPYRVARLTSQVEQVEGAPIGTRGGISVVHHFPADGEYVFHMEFYNDDVGDLHGRSAPFDEQIEVSINGERVALHDIDRFMTDSDLKGVAVETEPIFVRGGPQRVSAAFLQQWEGPVNDVLAPMGHSIVDVWIGKERGITNVTHLQELTITGPATAQGLAGTPSREHLFSCRPSGPAASDARSCAESILTRIGTQAYRRPVDTEDLQGILTFYDLGFQTGGFEEGIRMGLEAILASPFFVFRLESEPTGVNPGQVFALDPLEVASRLSYFIWGQGPDAELLEAAVSGALSQPAALDAQLSRLLTDPRSEALATRFASQWLQLAGLNAIQPDYVQYPDYDQQLMEAMSRETELFFHYLVQEDRSLREFYEADYTFVNERLARHYRIDGVVGDNFRRVALNDPNRRGILGHASILTLTSHGSRTSPVDRGKWVLEVLVGTPPPPPPPDVNTELAPIADASQGRSLTMRERLEMHRANPACSSCHNMIDPVGLALESFDVIGQWRIRDGESRVDSSTELWDGSPIQGPADLRNALLGGLSESVYRAFTQNLMTYALGRRVEYFDMPTVRSIVSSAAANDYRMSSFIRGVVHSPAFLMKQADALSDVEAPLN
jgi:mono/diheme cytochrome c family protein